MGKVLLPEDPRHIERVWWNGVDHRAEGCAYVTLGALPGGSSFFVRRSDTGRWTQFDARDDALAVALLLAKGWTPVIVPQPVGSPA